MLAGKSVLVLSLIILNVKANYIPNFDFFSFFFFNFFFFYNTYTHINYNSKTATYSTYSTTLFFLNI